MLIILSFAAFHVTCQPSGQKQGTQIQTIDYHGIRPTDPDGRKGLRNPERGFRNQTVFADPPGTPAWGPNPPFHLKGRIPRGYSDDWWILDAQRYEEHGLTMVQTYCYLDRFNDQPLSAEKLMLLQKSLDKLREHGLKAVLRFAYEKDVKRAGGPTLETILGHLEQLAPVIRENADIIYVLQAGLVGAWGEWHSSTRGLEKDHAQLAAIAAKILEVLPENRMTQVRVPKYKRWVLSQPALNAYQEVNPRTAHTGIPAARIGFHNDGFLAGNNDGWTWTEGPFYANPGNPEFDYMTRESPYVVVSGELFWGDDAIDGLRAAIRLRLHHYSVLSLAHNFSERHPEGKSGAIDRWMQVPLTLDEVRRAKLPVSDGYFEDDSGIAVLRTQFEYIRDHLGYRLELQSASFPLTVEPGSVLPVKVQLVNRGFSVIHNPRPVYFVLIDDNDRVIEFRVEDTAPRTWQPFQPGDETYQPLVQKIEDQISVPTDLELGRYRLGLWMPGASQSIRMDSRYAVRVANRDVPWWTNAEGGCGVNILGEIQMEQ